MTGGVFLVRACCAVHQLYFQATSRRQNVSPVVISLSGLTIDQMKISLGLFVELSSASGFVWEWRFEGILHPEQNPPPEEIARLNWQVQELAKWWNGERDRLSTALYFPPGLARVAERRGGMTGEIDWPEVRRRAETDEDGSGAAIVLLSAFSQGALLGQRDGADATPEGLEPSAIPVVVEWAR